MFPHTDLNDYFYFELNSNEDNFYRYNDEFGFIKTMKGPLNDTIKLQGDLTNFNSESNLLDYENYIGGKRFLILIFISSTMISFLILIIIFAINKLRIIL